MNQILKLTSLLKNKLYFFILEVFLFSLMIYFTYFSPAQEYETSIYLKTPIYFWIIFLINFILILSNIFYYLNKNSAQWKINYVYLIILNIFLINLYNLRGYYMLFGNSDAATYLGYSKDVLNYGTFGTNFYPYLSILNVIISIFCNLDVLFILKIIPTIFYIIYNIFLYLFSSSIIKNQYYIRIFLLISIPLFYSSFFISYYPMLLSILLIPLTLYLLNKERLDNRYSILCIMIFSILIIFHPITSLFILLYKILFYLYDLKNKSTYYNNSYIIIVIMALFNMWFLNQVIIIKDVFRIIAQILEGDITTLTSTQYYVSSLGLLNSIKFLLLTNADEIIYFSLSLIIGIVLLLKDKKGKIRNYVYIYIISLISYFVLFLTTRIHEPDRLLNLNPNLILTLPIISMGIYALKIKRKNLLLSFFIILIFNISMFSLYPSPYITTPNPYTTKNEVNSIKWLITYKYSSTETTSIISPLDRYENILFGVYGLNKFTLSYWSPTNDHFKIQNNTILFISKFEEIAYSTTWSFTNKFTREDFTEINNSFNKLYDSNGEKVYITK